MRLEFRRSSTRCNFDSAEVDSKNQKAARDLAKASLEIFYEFTPTCFHPKPEFVHSAPDEVAVLDEEGRTVVKYSIADMVSDRRVYLTSK